MAAQVRAWLTEDGTRFVMERGAWSMEAPVDDLRHQTAFYRDLRDRKAPRDKQGRVTAPGPYHAIYQPNVEALEAIARQLREVAQ